MTAVELIRGDITKVEADAIVNAANKELLPGGGVDGAIHRAGGPEIAREARAIADRDGNLPTGEAVATTAGNLPARYVIHTVGPIWDAHPEDEATELLGRCYESCLNTALEMGCNSVAFPNISTGVYGFPKQLAGDTAVSAVRSWIDHHPGDLERVVFVVFDEENEDIYQRLLAS